MTRIQPRFFRIPDFIDFDRIPKGVLTIDRACVAEINGLANKAHATSHESFIFRIDVLDLHCKMRVTQVTGSGCGVTTIRRTVLPELDKSVRGF